MHALNEKKVEPIWGPHSNGVSHFVVGRSWPVSCRLASLCTIIGSLRDALVHSHRARFTALWHQWPI